jgi:signal transduction histidine kinase
MLADHMDVDIHQLLNIAIRSTERIQRLTNSLLDINRLEMGQVIGDRKLVDPAEIIRFAAEAVSPVVSNKGITLIAHVPSALPMVKVDEDMIRRVLINLAENAIKFTPQGGCIKVGASQNGSAVEWYVQDNGPGIPAVEHSRIFEKFARVKIEDGPKGLGLGLAFCRLAVTAHGGRIWVESEPGAGAAFRFTLPVAEDG